ncbi:class II aldolase/adducin family protein [Acetobacter musti]|uniref:Class II aldolase/adducin family protein n=1 Tax=Acetobacter musti TaxID=864732 RepID=A0ABX0JSM9_9PROT|nr:class II aldolase/adducin family protein [Acetobacter musti]NHN84950.1 class II aldolase/adducin family protein [Acetobacter musti]
MNDEEWQARTDLAACYRLVASMGLDDLIYNHISMRVPGTDNQFLINPYGMLFDEITASCLVKIDIDGNKLDESPYEVNAAGFVIHGAVHAARPDAHCVLHVHSTASVAVSSQKSGLLPLSQFAMWFWKRQGFHDYEGVALDLDERCRLVRDLGSHPVLLMRNHGLLTVGQNPAAAFMMLYYFERAASIQLALQATAAGGPDAMPCMPPAEVCDRAAEQFWGHAGDILSPGVREWNGLLRRLERAGQSPDYRS